MLELIKQTRSFRRFEQHRRISEELLTELIELARLAGSARNQQTWQYMLITDPAQCEKIFPFLGWAGYLTDWKGPEKGQRPNCYIFCLLNRNWLKGSEKEAHFDLGTATQNVLLGAMEQGIGGCRIGAFSAKLADLYEFPDHLELSLVLALGYPAEVVELSDLVNEGDIRYFRNEADTHVVPKRALSELIVKLKCK